MNDNDDNVIAWKPRENAPQQKSPQNHPPLINLPPATKYLTGVLIVIHILLWISTDLFHAINADLVFYNFGFVPARLTDFSQFSFLSLASLLTFTFLHGGWMHLFINAISLAAFGTGVEKFLGARRMLLIFFLTSLIAALSHLAVSPFSPMPIVGASGGVSGLFGAVLVFLQYNGQLAQTKNRILPIVIVFLLISVLFGYLGAPDGSPIAWIAHIGGFISGIGIAKIMVKKLRW